AGARVVPAIRAVARRYRGRSLGDGYRLKLCPSTMTRLFYEWRVHPCPDVFKPRRHKKARQIDPEKLERAIQFSAGGSATVDAVLRAYRKLDRCYFGSDMTLRRSLGGPAFARLAEVRRLRVLVREAARRELRARMLEERARDALDSARAKLGVGPVQVDMTINGVRVHCTCRGELLKMESDTGGRITARQRNMVHKVFRLWRPDKVIHEHTGK
ncbi:MAG: hypothetical protein NTV49_01010, partial [Kiritimatiellaeota bacterium]|nr:hypothetical protein [Kiritimatiellota bacterium]